VIILIERKTSDEERFKRIGLNISLYRKYKNLTQAELAEAVNISRTHMSNIEAPNVVKPMSLELIFKIADVLGIEVSALFEKV